MKGGMHFHTKIARSMSVEHFGGGLVEKSVPEYRWSQIIRDLQIFGVIYRVQFIFTGANCLWKSVLSKKLLQSFPPSQGPRTKW